jgi:hypothetical protein
MIPASHVRERRLRSSRMRRRTVHSLHNWIEHRTLQKTDHGTQCQSAQLDLAHRAGLLQPADPLLHQSSPARVYGVAGLARSSAIQVARMVVIVPVNVRRHFQLPHRVHEVIAITNGFWLHAQRPDF